MPHTEVTKLESKKGQQAVIGLLFAFLLVATAAIITAPLLEFVEVGINASQNATAHADLMVTIIGILPVFIWLVVLIAVVLLISTR